MSKRPTPLQIARYGHIAGALRAFLTERKWSGSDLGRELGVSVSAPHAWVSAKGAPNPAMQKKLVKLTGLPKETFMRREPDKAGPASPPVWLPGPAAARRVGEALSFTINEAGEARIRLDVSMPLAQAMPLVRLLLDAEAVTRIGETLG